MKNYLLKEDFEAWKVIKNGPMMQSSWKSLKMMKEEKISSSLLLMSLLTILSLNVLPKKMMEKLVEMEEAKQESPQSDVCLMAMERISISLFKEGYSIMRPSFFNGENYFYWKNMMKLFIQSNDYHVLKLIVNGPNIPTKEVNEVDVPKEEDE